MKAKIFIDGREGTTGLQIYERLESRDDIELITISEELRKDTAARKECINAADIVFLCLPDDAARESVALIENEKTRVIDASTAHRTNPNWDYGFPELSSRRRAEIWASPRVANPGCHATGFLALVYPLIEANILPKEAILTCHSLTGYSGGGKSHIAQYTAPDRPESFSAPRIYGLGLKHKHLPEMMAESGLKNAPMFTPVEADYYAGMAVSVLLHESQLTETVQSEELRDVLAVHYEKEKFITVNAFGEEESLDTPGFVEANALVGTNKMEILVYGNGAQTLLIARFDNLGKGASGAAVQNMNIMLGFDETTGL